MKTLFLLACLPLILLVSGCQTIITIPPGAPIMLSQDETLHNVFIRQHGAWVSTKGVAIGHAGQTLITLPATRPAN